MTVCGGRNCNEELDKCNRYDFTDFKWKEIPPMNSRRIGATSSLTPEGDIWILGGTTQSENNLKTEVYDFERDVWRTGIELPEVFRDTGITDHCTVRYAIL